MGEILFFQQRRNDDGLRTGIDINGSTVWHKFESSTEDDDPSLRWYIDVRCKGDSLPNDAEEVRKWLVEQREVIAPALEAAAERLSAGFDNNFQPLRRTVTPSPPGVQIELVISAMRGIRGPEISTEIENVGSEWSSVLNSLSRLSNV